MLGRKPHGIGENRSRRWFLPQLEGELKKMDDNVLWLNKLVPKHVLLDESEIEKKLEPLQMNKYQLPKILLKDPALGALKDMGSEAKPGDVIEIHRFSDNAGANIAYRLVVEE